MGLESCRPNLGNEHVSLHGVYHKESLAFDKTIDDSHPQGCFTLTVFAQLAVFCYTIGAVEVKSVQEAVGHSIQLLGVSFPVEHSHKVVAANFLKLACSCWRNSSLVGTDKSLAVWWQLAINRCDGSITTFNTNSI